MTLLTACSGGGGGGGALAPTLVFDAPSRYPTGGQGARELALGDLNRDGVVDALVSNGDVASLSFLPGVVSGGFAGGHLLPAPSQAGPVAIGDLDGDRAPDLAAGSPATGDVAITRNHGGAFVLPDVTVLAAPTRDLRIADVSGDGRNDVVVAHLSVPAITVLIGDGAGGSAGTLPLSLPAPPGDLVVADCNADGRVDLITVGAFGGHIMVLTANGSGGFLAAQSSPVPLQSGVLVAGDIDRDGMLDLAALDFQRVSVSVLRGNGGGQFAVAATRTLPGVANGLALADLDLDGALDLVAAVDRQIVACYGNGAAGFGAPEVLTTDSRAVSGLVAGDFDGNGRTDLAYLAGADEVALLENPKPLALGLAQYGLGTADCAGPIGLIGRGVPRVGNAAFAFVGTNAPPEAIGFLLLGGPPDIAGSDAFQAGFRLHLGFGLIVTRLVRSDLHGSMSAAEPIPATPSLAGLALYVQALWQGRPGQACTPSPAGVSSSRGLAVTIQP